MITSAPRIKYGWLRAVLFFISFFIFIAVFDLIGIAIVSSITEYSFKEYGAILEKYNANDKKSRKRKTSKSRKRQSRKGIKTRKGIQSKNKLKK